MDIKLLRKIVDQAIDIKQQIEDLQGDLSKVYASAKSVGLDKKAVKEVVRRATMDMDQYAATEQLDLLVESYWSNYKGSETPARAREYMADDNAVISITPEIAEKTLKNIKEYEEESRLSKLREALA